MYIISYTVLDEVWDLGRRLVASEVESPTFQSTVGAERWRIGGSMDPKNDDDDDDDDHNNNKESCEYYMLFHMNFSTGTVFFPLV